MADDAPELPACFIAVTVGGRTYIYDQEVWRFCRTFEGRVSVVLTHREEDHSITYYNPDIYERKGYVHHGN